MQYKVSENIKAGNVSYYSPRRKILENAPYGVTVQNVFAKEDLAPGDIVEIVGDYAVKVQASYTVPIGYVPAGTTITQQDLVDFATSVNAFPSSQSSPTAPPARSEKTECRCPFGPNLGPIVHKRGCHGAD